MAATPNAGAQRHDLGPTGVCCGWAVRRQRDAAGDELLALFRGAAIPNDGMSSTEDRSRDAVKERGNHGRGPYQGNANSRSSAWIGGGPAQSPPPQPITEDALRDAPGRSLAAATTAILVYD